MANYHPHDELLMSFAAGQLSNALGLMISCHLEHCAECRHKVRQFEAIGGALLDSAPSSMSDSEVALKQGKHPALENLLAKIDAESDQSEIIIDVNNAKQQKAKAEAIGKISIPRPLRRFVESNLDDIEWSGMSKHIKEYELNIADTDYSAKFYKISAGRVLPEHTHRGQEYTLVLSGSFSDRTCRYQQGDFILADDSVVHQPRASEEADCICFAVMDAPLKMTGFFGRMLNPFLK